MTIAFNPAQNTYLPLQHSGAAGRCCEPKPEVGAEVVDPQTAAAAGAKRATQAEASMFEMLSRWQQQLGQISNVGRWLDGVGGNLVPANAEALNDNTDAGQQSAATLDAHAVQHQRGSIVIHTQEGDTLRIRFGTRSEYELHSAAVEGARGDASASAIEISQRSRLRIQIEGDLNDEERHAIDAVLNKVQSLAEDFFAGDIEAAFAEAQSLSMDSAQLANVAVRLHQSQRVSVQVRQVTIQPVATLPVANLPEPTPVITTPVAPAAHDSVPVFASKSVPVTESDPAPVLTPLNETQSRAPSATQTSTQSLVRYIAKMSEQLHGDTQAEKWGLTFNAKLKIVMAAIHWQRPNVESGALQSLQDAVQQTNALQQ